MIDGWNKEGEHERERERWGREDKREAGFVANLWDVVVIKCYQEVQIKNASRWKHNLCPKVRFDIVRKMYNDLAKTLSRNYAVMESYTNCIHLGIMSARTIPLHIILFHWSSFVRFEDSRSWMSRRGLVFCFLVRAAVGAPDAKMERVRVRACLDGGKSSRWVELKRHMCDPRQRITCVTGGSLNRCKGQWNDSCNILLYHKRIPKEWLYTLQMY